MKPLTVRRRIWESLGGGKTPPTICPRENKASELFPLREARRGKTVAEARAEGVTVQPEPSIFICSDDPEGKGAHEIGTMFHCAPLCGLDNHTSERMLSLLNTDFPAGSLLTFTFWRSPDVLKEVSDIYALRSGNRNPDSADMARIIKKRAEFFDEGTRTPVEPRSGTKAVTQELLVTLKFKISDTKPTDAELLRLRVYADKLFGSLETVGCFPEIATPESLLRSTQTFLNWSPMSGYRLQKVRYNPSEPLNTQILDYDTKIVQNDDHLKFEHASGARYCKMLSAKRLADMMYFGDAIAYVGDLKGKNNSVKDNYFVSTSIYYPDHETAKNKHNTQRAYVINQAKGPLVAVAPVLREKARDFDEINQCLSDGNRPIEISYHIGVYGDSKSEVDQSAMSMIQNWKGLRFDLMVDDLVQLPIFINCMPLCADIVRKDLNRQKPMTTRQAMPLLPIFGEWKGTGTHHTTLLSRNGALMSMSLHDTGTNQNFTISATSGSGKSFLSNYITESYLTEGGEVWIIDVGRSYEKLAAALGGEFIHFGETSNACLNPFPLIKDWDDEEDAIIGLLAVMAAPTVPLNDWQTSVLKQVAQQVWSEKGNEMTIDDIASRLEQHADIRARDIGQQMFSFTSKGAYGRYFNGPNNVNFRAAFNVLELEELKSRYHLQKAVLFLLIYQIQQSVFMASLEGRKRKRMILIDESWDLISGSSSDGKADPIEKFIEAFYRRARKYGAFIGICTQSLTDLFHSKVGNAIHENSATTILLKQKKDTIKKLETQGNVALSKAQVAQLETVHTIIGVYSEMMIMGDHGSGVGRLFVSEYQKLLYSTNPDDVSAIETAKVEHNCSYVEAIERVLAARKGLKYEEEHAA